MPKFPVINENIQQNQPPYAKLIKTAHFSSTAIVITSVPSIRVKELFRLLAADDVQSLLEDDHIVVRALAGSLPAEQFLQLCLGLPHSVACNGECINEC